MFQLIHHNSAHISVNLTSFTVL